MSVPTNPLNMSPGQVERRRIQKEWDKRNKDPNWAIAYQKKRLADAMTRIADQLEIQNKNKRCRKSKA